MKLEQSLFSVIQIRIKNFSTTILRDTDHLGQISGLHHNLHIIVIFVNIYREEKLVCGWLGHLAPIWQGGASRFTLATSLAVGLSVNYLENGFENMWSILLDCWYMFILSVEINISRAVAHIDVNVSTSSMTVNTEVKSVSLGSGWMLPFWNDKIITSIETVLQ